MFLNTRGKDHPGNTMLFQCWFIIGPALQTLTQCWTSIGWTTLVYWGGGDYKWCYSTCRFRLIRRRCPCRQRGASPTPGGVLKSPASRVTEAGSTVDRRGIVEPIRPQQRAQGPTPRVQSHLEKPFPSRSSLRVRFLQPMWFSNIILTV